MAVLLLSWGSFYVFIYVLFLLLFMVDLFILLYGFNCYSACTLSRIPCYEMDNYVNL